MPFLPRFILPALLFVAGFTARAEIIYDNSTDFPNPLVYYSLNEYGDEVVLGGSSRIITQIMLECYGDLKAAAGDETARLRLYLNDGPKTASGDSMPGTLLFDSGNFNVLPGYQTKVLSGLKVNVPDDFTWTVQFGGMAGKAGDEAGLIFVDPPTVGSSADDIWMRKNDVWQLYTWQGNPIANFKVRIIGADPSYVTIRTASNKAIVEWVGLSILQISDKATGPFVDLPNARNRYEMSLGTSKMKFFRLRD
jgi:hypothetical protein